MRISFQNRQITLDGDCRDPEINQCDGPFRTPELSTQAPEMTRSGLVEWQLQRLLGGMYSLSILQHSYSGFGQVHLSLEGGTGRLP